MVWGVITNGSCPNWVGTFRIFRVVYITKSIGWAISIKPNFFCHMRVTERHWWWMNHNISVVGNSVRVLRDNPIFNIVKKSLVSNSWRSISEKILNDVTLVMKINCEECGNSTSQRMTCQGDLSTRVLGSQSTSTVIKSNLDILICVKESSMNFTSRTTVKWEFKELCVLKEVIYVLTASNWEDQ